MYFSYVRQQFVKAENILSLLLNKSKCYCFFVILSNDHCFVKFFLFFYSVHLQRSAYLFISKKKSSVTRLRYIFCLFTSKKVHSNGEEDEKIYYEIMKNCLEWRQLAPYYKLFAYSYSPLFYYFSKTMMIWNSCKNYSKTDIFFFISIKNVSWKSWAYMKWKQLQTSNFFRWFVNFNNRTTENEKKRHLIVCTTDINVWWALSIFFCYECLMSYSCCRMQYFWFYFDWYCWC